jgi:uncharacterized protein YceK
MKKLAIIFAVVIAGCSSVMKLDQQKAKDLVEALEQKINSGDYAGTTQYYSEVMNRNQTPDQLAEKFKKIKAAVGDFVSMECISCKNGTDENDMPCVNLVYTVKHTKVNTTEGFTVVREEGGYKVSLHDIAQMQ